MLAPFCSTVASPDKLLTLAQACELAQVHPNSIRNWDSAGKLQCFRTPGGIRRVSFTSLMTLLGERNETTVSDENKQGKSCGPIAIAACIRVSSRGQALANTSTDKSSLDHQEQRVRAFIGEKFKGQEVKVTWFKRVASGMDFNNTVFHRMIQGILEGQFRYLVATDFTRISRFGIQLIDHLCKLGNCEILYSLRDEEVAAKSDNETLVDDVLSILQHYTAKTTGLKAKAIQEVKVEPDVLRRVLQLHSDGQSTRAIARLFKREGVTGTAGGKTREITKTVVNRIIKDNGKLVKELTGNASRALSRTNVADFFAERVRLSGEGQTLRLASLVEAYRAWSFKRGEVPSRNASALPSFIQKQFPGVQELRERKGQKLYRGLSLLPEKCSESRC